MIAETLRDLQRLERRVERLERIEVPPYTVNLRSFGGKVTATYAQNDTAFTQAFQALADKGGGTLLVPGNGTYYRKSTPIWVPYSNICVKFEPGASVRLEDDSDCQGLVVATDGEPTNLQILENVILDGVVVYCNAANQTPGAYDFAGDGHAWPQYGIAAIGVDNIVVKGCRTYETVNTGIQLARIGRNKVINCQVFDAGLMTGAGAKNGIGVMTTLPFAVGEDTENWWYLQEWSEIRNCEVHGAYDEGITCLFYGKSGFRIVDNRAYANWTTFPANDDPTWAPNGTGIWIETDSTTDAYAIRNTPAIISRNYSRGWHNGISCLSKGPSDHDPMYYTRVDLCDNIIQDCEESGIMVSGVGIHVHHNQIRNWGCQAHPQLDEYGLPIEADASAIRVIDITNGDSATVQSDIIIDHNLGIANTDLWLDSDPRTANRAGINLVTFHDEIRRRIKIDDNIMVGPGTSATEDDYSGGIMVNSPLQDCEFDGNDLSGFYHGVHLRGGAGASTIDRFRLSRGILHDNLSCGLFAHYGTSNLRVEHVETKNNGQLPAATYKAGIYLTQNAGARIHDLIAYDDDAGTQAYGLYLTATDVTGIRVELGDLSGNATAACNNTTRAELFRNVVGVNPLGVKGPPVVPASTVAYTNVYEADCMVFVTGGTVTVIAIDGVATGLIAGSFHVPRSSTITITYTVVPTWVWYAL